VPAGRRVPVPAAVVLPFPACAGRPALLAGALASTVLDAFGRLTRPRVVAFAWVRSARAFARVAFARAVFARMAFARATFARATFVSVAARRAVLARSTCGRATFDWAGAFLRRSVFAEVPGRR
jgi:hypothetical protein